MNFVSEYRVRGEGELNLRPGAWGDELMPTLFEAELWCVRRIPQVDAEFDGGISIIIQPKK